MLVPSLISNWGIHFFPWKFPCSSQASESSINLLIAHVLRSTPWLPTEASSGNADAQKGNCGWNKVGWGPRNGQSNHRLRTSCRVWLRIPCLDPNHSWNISTQKTTPSMFHYLPCFHILCKTKIQTLYSIAKPAFNFLSIVVSQYPQGDWTQRRRQSLWVFVYCRKWHSVYKYFVL